MFQKTLKNVEYHILPRNVFYLVLIIQKNVLNKKYIFSIKS